jgi:glycosyltransferase involved in cell wall biosynthesis
MDEVIAAYSHASWYLGSANLGFAAAVNALAREVPRHDLLLLNPDATLQGTLTGTFAALRKPGVAAAGPLVVVDKADLDRHRAWDVAHREQSVARALVSKAGYAPRIRGRRWSELYRTAPTAVSGYITGACLAISRDAWDAIGSFDENFFLYGEEAEWQRRARSAGWSIELVDEPGITHTGHGTVAGDPVAGMRSRDLLRANIALNMELDKGSLPANLYLAGTSVLDRVQRSARRERAARRRPAGSRPSVIITTNRLVSGVAERSRVLLASELDRRGYEVAIACVQGFGPLVAEIPASIRIVRQPWWAPVADVGAGKSIVISGDTNRETGFAALWRTSGRNRRWLVAAHTTPNSGAPTYSRGLALAMRRSDGFIAMSPKHLDEATAHQNLGARSFIAPLGMAPAADVDMAPVRPPPSAVPHLVMLSRMIDHESPHILVEALDGLHELPWRLSIFGDGPVHETLQPPIPPDLADRVVWRGWTSDRDKALADCDLLCVPDPSDAFPLLILEAMALRVPVAGSAVCAIGDMLDGGRAGFLVNDISVSGWRTVLEAALREIETWNQLGERGFERMREVYTIEAMADAYESAIAAVVE